MQLKLAAALVLMAAHLPANDTPADAGAVALQARHAELTAPLAQSPFQRPLVLQAAASATGLQGEIHAVIEHPFHVAATALEEPAGWCALLLLQTNIKRCAVLGAAPDQRLQIAVVRRYSDPVEQAHSVELRFTLKHTQEHYLSLELGAREGPLGTRNYRLRFEAVPIDTGATFVHLTYGYEAGMAARMATNLYLATSGKDKVGFTTTGRSAQGQPVYVRGIQGVAERNTLRYFLAIESFLGSLRVPQAQRLKNFHAALERYPAQLRELSLDEYLQLKRDKAR